MNLSTQDQAQQEAWVFCMLQLSDLATQSDSATQWLERSIGENRHVFFFLCRTAQLVQGGVDNHALQALQANDLHVTCADFVVFL